MNTRIGLAVVTTSVLFTVSVGVVAQTPQINSVYPSGAQTPIQRAIAAHNSTLTQFPQS